MGCPNSKDIRKQEEYVHKQLKNDKCAFELKKMGYSDKKISSKFRQLYNNSFWKTDLRKDAYIPREKMEKAEKAANKHRR